MKNNSIALLLFIATIYLVCTALTPLQKEVKVITLGFGTLFGVAALIATNERRK